MHRLTTHTHTHFVCVVVYDMKEMSFVCEKRLQAVGTKPAKKQVSWEILQQREMNLAARTDQSDVCVSTLPSNVRSQQPSTGT